MKSWLFVASLSVLTASCYYDVEEELYPNGCSTENVTYSANVVPVLSANCYSCHNTAVQSGGVVLEGYDNLKVYVDNGRLLSAIKQDGNAKAMPQGGAKLPPCTIQKIEAWILNGAVND